MITEECICAKYNHCDSLEAHYCEACQCYTDDCLEHYPEPSCHCAEGQDCDVCEYYRELQLRNEHDCKAHMRYRESTSDAWWQCTVCGEIEDAQPVRVPRIATSYIFPPIPIRSSDWIAWIDGDEEGPRAFGATEAEAIENLREAMDVPRKPMGRENEHVAEPFRTILNSLGGVR